MRVNRQSTRRTPRPGLRACALGAAVAAALTLTACDQSSADPKTAHTESPATNAPASPSAASPSPSKSASTPAAEPTASTTTPRAASPAGWKYAHRQTPPTGSVCDHDGQGPYAKIESVSFGGESPTLVGLVLGHYDCDGAKPRFVPSSATGAATDVLVDTNHLKTVVGGRIASRMGTRTPAASPFLDELARMQDKGELKGAKAPEFWFRIDAPSDDVNAMPDDNSRLIYLYQLVDAH
ncbi:MULTISPECIES: hypothetical protein [unclassified Streptomyces]|uniref:hypothetical protein n=1 Tax=unclassified Streptomyces TaxID=2593676 RepID=UPI000DB958AC|nr:MULTISPECIES: hypothetical protein [unclassified Streptomyces]MYT75380.1 hypothetical protein [Streptomyces sp. SID8367]RAJ86782.1 hypothetical protein K377_02462 [Streptomyces sp. PsTaAH-137]